MKIEKRKIIMGVLFEPGNYLAKEIIEKISKIKKRPYDEIERSLIKQGLITLHYKDIESKVEEHIIKRPRKKNG